MNSRLERLEAVQAVLLEIGKVASTCSDIHSFLGAVHQALGRLMYAANFYVALCEPDSDAVRFVYFVDERAGAPDPARPVALAPADQSPTAWVILNQRNLTLTATEQNARSGGAGWDGGSTAEHWMGCPLLDQQHVTIGAIVIQSYDAEHTFNPEDQALFALIGTQIASAIVGMQGMDRLERAVRERTALLAHEVAERRRALEALQQAQSDLVRQEKLASLGRLVAGVAHEINTPLGICVTATSHLVQELKLTREELAAGAMTEESLQQFLEIVDQSLRIMTANTQRAAALVRSFKQVAVDQSSDDMRRFHLKRYLDEVLLSLQPKLKGRPVQVHIDCPAELELVSFPGALSQIITNMVVNSLVHGFEREQKGTIRIGARMEADGFVMLEYSDDGVGMDEDTLDKLFDPFFTTRRGQGGSGLGAHILFNLVTGALGGTVKVDSAPGMGLHYRLRFPRQRGGQAARSVGPALVDADGSIDVSD